MIFPYFSYQYPGVKAGGTGKGGMGDQIYYT